MLRCSMYTAARSWTAAVVMARRQHEANALVQLRSSPYDPWLSFLREHRLQPTGEPEASATALRNSKWPSMRGFECRVNSGIDRW